MIDPSTPQSQFKKHISIWDTLYNEQSKEIPTIVCCCLEAAAAEAAAAAWAAAAEAVATLFSRICAGGEVRGR